MSRSDPMDEVCREAHKRGQVVLVLPGVAPLLVTRKPGGGIQLDEQQLARIERLASALAETSAATRAT